MSYYIDIEPFCDELPSDYADRLGVFYSFQVTANHKKALGQYFTPIPIAKLMSSFNSIKKSHIKLLDPGCGTAILTCTLIEDLVKRDIKIDTIELVGYETDDNLILYTRKSLQYLKIWLEKQGLNFIYTLNVSDFVLENVDALRDDNLINKYDIIIANPPYFKLSKSDAKTISAKELVSGQPNIYALFMGIASKLLVDNGEMIFITPRSFASGNYFRAFRKIFFQTIQVDKIHLFNSRKDTFNRDNVLQETLILKGIKKNIERNATVIISNSSGLKDILSPDIRSINYFDLVDIDSKEIILHLPTSEKEETILNLVSSWENTLSDFNINISTGPVVSFRATKFIQNKFENGTVFLAPLFWLQNVNKMTLDWPIALKEKGQYIRIQTETKSILIKNKNYIFLRRFSTKDDKSRLIAAPYFCNYIKSDFIGVENKLNYIYRKDGHLNRREVVGMCALLNSDLFDTYFQIFNGNVNVSATEIRDMKFPNIDCIKSIGERIITSNDYSMKSINKLIDTLFELENHQYK